MARADLFDGLSEFLAIVRYGSFRAAAAELGVTPGAISQALQTLEKRLGVPLFNRTTRKIALTEAGERLIASLGPATETILGTLDDLGRLRASPHGTFRLLVQRMGLAEVVEPVLPIFRARYPDVKVEVTVDEFQTEIITGGFDAGIRIGEFIDRDMVALRVSPPFDWLIVGAPAYFARQGRPEKPEDVANHECIRYRRPGLAGAYRWEFEREGQAVNIDPPGSLLSNDSDLLRAMAVAGLGLIYTASMKIRRELDQGLLEPVLQGFMPAKDSLFLYFPQASRNDPRLRGFVDTCLECVRR